MGNFERNRCRYTFRQLWKIALRGERWNGLRKAEWGYRLMALPIGKGRPEWLTRDRSLGDPR